MPSQSASQRGPRRQVKQEQASASARTAHRDQAELTAEDVRLAVDRAARRLVEGGQRATEVLVADEDFEHNPITKARFFTQPRRDARRAEMTRALIGAARGLADAYRDLLEQRQVWERLKSQHYDTGQLDVRGHVMLLEAVEQNVESLLKELGYGDGPPPAEQWAELIQQPLRLLVRGVEPGRAVHLAADAEHNLRNLVSWLDRLIANADAIDDTDPEQVRSMKARLRTMVSAARTAVAPTVIAAIGGGVAALVTGDPIDASAIAGGAAAVARAVDFGAVTWLGQRKNPSSANVDLDLEVGVTNLAAYIELAGSPPRDDDYASLLIRRAATQLALDSTRLGDSAREEAWLEWADKVSDMLTHRDFDRLAAITLWNEAQFLLQSVQSK